MTANALWPFLLPAAPTARDDTCAVSASGVRVRLLNGRELLCATSGLWNANLGYGNTVIADACARSLRDASYLGLFRQEHTYAREAAAALIQCAGPDRYARVLFSTSGGAANDLVMKAARARSSLRGNSERSIIVGLRGSYHGLTFGSFALSGEDLGQTLYGVDRRLVRHVTPNAVDEIEHLMEREGSRVAAVIVEPVLGNGTEPLGAEYIAALFALSDRFGFLVVADEVATGFGRTGPLFATSTWPRPPDMLVLSKGMTNGAMAAAAVLVSPAVAEALSVPGFVLAHAETQAGTPVACAAVVATIAEFERLDALRRGRRVATFLENTITDLSPGLPLRSELRGVGLFRTLVLRDDSNRTIPQTSVPALVAAIREAGAIVHPGLGGIQLVPALIYEEDDVLELAGAIVRGVEAFTRGRSAP